MHRHVNNSVFDLGTQDEQLVLELSPGETLARVQAQANAGSEWGTGVLSIEGQLAGASQWHALDSPPLTLSDDTLTEPFLVAGLARIRARVSTPAASEQRLTITISAAPVPITITL